MDLTRVQRYARSGAAGCAIGLGCAIPVSTALSSLLLLAFLLLWAAGGEYAAKLRTMRTNAVAIAMASFGLMWLVGMLWSPASGASLRDAAIDASRFFLAAILITVFVDPIARRRGISAFLASSTVILALSYLLWAGALEPRPWLKGTPDSPVVFKYHITHNVLMAMAALLFALEALEARSMRTKLLLWFGAVTAAANVLLLVTGRTGHLALLAGLLYLAFARLRWKGLGIAFAGIGLLAAVTWLTPHSVMHQRIATAIDEGRGWQADKPAAEDSSIGLRLEFYRNALALIAERPLFGAGTGAYAITNAKFVEGTGMHAGVNPHNAFLHIGVELGLVGLAILLAVLVVQWRTAATLPTFGLQAAARSLVVVFSVAGMVSSTFIDHAEGLYYAWASALFFAAASRPRPP